MSNIEFTEAITPEQIEQIHRLNHKIFAEEVRQHHTTADGLLIDRFHAKNHYFIAVKDNKIVGMISAHDGPLFSVASRLFDASILIRLRAPLEVRLLAVQPRYRNRSLLAGLFWQVHRYAKAHNYSDMLISGITERLPMYQKLGFLPLGPPVPDGAAAFVPMCLSLDTPTLQQQRRQQLYASHWQRMQE